MLSIAGFWFFSIAKSCLHDGIVFPKFLAGPKGYNLSIWLESDQMTTGSIVSSIGWTTGCWFNLSVWSDSDNHRGSTCYGNWFLGGPLDFRLGLMVVGFDSYCLTYIFFFFLVDLLLMVKMSWRFLYYELNFILFFLFKNEYIHHYILDQITNLFFFFLLRILSICIIKFWFIYVNMRYMRYITCHV